MLNRVLLPLAAAFACVTPASALRDWSIEPGFDIVGNDVANIRGTSDNCSMACYDAMKAGKNCYAWTWTNYQGGTCWLKSWADKFVVNANAISARWVWSSESLDACYLYDNVDFYGNDIGSKKASKAEDCCDICKKTLGCRAYSWNNYEGGTCWLKSERGNKLLVKAGVKSGNAYSSWMPFKDYFYAVEAGVDYFDHDIANAKGADPTKCNDLCSQQVNCTAYSWSNYQGGTCWLKSGRDKTVANAAVTSGLKIQAISPMAHP